MEKHYKYKMHVINHKEEKNDVEELIQYYTSNLTREIRLRVMTTHFTGIKDMNTTANTNLGTRLTYNLAH